MREHGSGTRQRIEEFLSRHGLSVRDLHVTLTMGSIESIKAAVEAGNGIAMLSIWAVRKEVEDGRLKTVSLRDAGITRDFSLSNADKELVLFIKNYAYNIF